MKATVASISLQEGSLRAETNFTQAVLDNAGAIILVIRSDGAIVRFNREAERLTGYSESEVFGRKFEDIFLLPEEREGVEQTLDRLNAGDFPNTHENHWRTKSGEKCLIQWRNTVLLDEVGRIDLIVAIGVDVTEERATQHRLEEAMRELHEAQIQLEIRNVELEEVNKQLKAALLTDPLTGQWNRRAFDERLAAEISLAKRHDRTFSILLIDIDGLRQGGDRLGARDGDHILVAIGSSIRRMLRTSDFIARFSGEEFVVVLQQAEQSDAREVADRIRQHIESERYRRGTITVSIGVAEYEAIEEVSTILERAEAATATAKALGGNCVQ